MAQPLGLDWLVFFAFLVGHCEHNPSIIGVQNCDFDLIHTHTEHRYLKVVIAIVYFGPVDTDAVGKRILQTVWGGAPMYIHP